MVVFLPRLLPHPPRPPGKNYHDRHFRGRKAGYRDELLPGHSDNKARSPRKEAGALPQNTAHVLDPLPCPQTEHQVISAEGPGRPRLSPRRPRTSV